MSSDHDSSLLSLSIAAASAVPIPLQHNPLLQDSAPNSLVDSPGSFNNHTSLPISASVGSAHKTHRRLASTGKTRRRLSDAREAATRPSPAMLHASPPALSLASLSLSTSPPSDTQVSSSLTGVSRALASAQAVPLNDGSNIPHSSAASNDATSVKPIPISNGSGKKRGVEHKCESCSKIYRHPSCLIKHRWEHTPHWREASKFVLSKHQQVQLLEAAAILSHLSPQASSLPDDRSLWPSFLSGGSLPPPDPSTLMSTSDSRKSTTSSVSTSAAATIVTPAVSSSVPATSGYARASSTGPRMHDYSIPVGATTNGGVTQLRPGLLGVPNSSGSGVSPAANNGSGNSITANGVNGTPTQPMSVPVTTSDSWSSVSIGENGRARWSLPRSSVRSVSGSSRSRSGSASDEESESLDVDGDGDEYGYIRRRGGYGGRYAMGYGSTGGYSAIPRGSIGGTGVGGLKTWKREEEEFSVGFSVQEEDEHEKELGREGRHGEEKEWDGMEMEMDMD